jgi:hypothetical protein
MTWATLKIKTIVTPKPMPANTLIVVSNLDSESINSSLRYLLMLKIRAGLEVNSGRRGFVVKHELVGAGILDKHVPRNEDVLTSSADLGEPDGEAFAGEFANDS